jgi:uncharacterized membrane protein YdbT with pleckstrin-like domain
VKLNCVGLKAFLYVSIASLTTLIADLSVHKSFSEITDIGLAIICINFALQGLIAWRAYLDQSVSRDRAEKERKNKELKVELLNENNK